MKKLTVTLCLTITVFLGSLGASNAAGYKEFWSEYKNSIYLTAVGKRSYFFEQRDKNLENTNISEMYSPKSILFLGNSLTYYNLGISHVLSGLIKNSRTNLIPNINQKVMGGYNLNDHYQYSFPLNYYKK